MKAALLRGPGEVVLEEVPVPEISDEEVLEVAQKEKRVIVTLDKDFCSLVFFAGEKAKGVILVRLENESSENIAVVLDRVLTDFMDKIEGNFLVVDEEQIRIRKIRKKS